MESTRFSRSEEFNPDRYGFTFHKDGSFTERKNSGWCGTPPIAYDNFEGSWKPLSDTLIDITVAYWGGTLTYQMQIVPWKGMILGSGISSQKTALRRDSRISLKNSIFAFLN